MHMTPIAASYFTLERPFSTTRHQTEKKEIRNLRKSRKEYIETYKTNNAITLEGLYKQTRNREATKCLSFRTIENATNANIYGYKSSIPFMATHLSQYQSAVLDRFTWPSQRSLLINHYMGTGKTLTAITCMYYAYIHLGITDFLVIAPAALSGTWKGEIKAWLGKCSLMDCPEDKDKFKAKCDKGNGSHVDPVQKNSPVPNDFINLFTENSIYSYEDAIGLQGDFSAIQEKIKRGKCMVVLDEVHVIHSKLENEIKMSGSIDPIEMEKRTKNAEGEVQVPYKVSNLSQFLAEVENASRLLMLSGTPIKSSIMDLVVLLNILSRQRTGKPVLPSSREVFQHEYMKLNRSTTKLLGLSFKVTPTLSEVIRPVLLSNTVMFGQLSRGIFLCGMGGVLDIALGKKMMDPLLKSGLPVALLNYTTPLHIAETLFGLWCSKVGHRTKSLENYRKQRYYSLNKEKLLPILKQYVDYYDLSDIPKSRSDFPWKLMTIEEVPYSGRQIVAHMCTRLLCADREELRKIGGMDSRLHNLDYMSDKMVHKSDGEEKITYKLNRAKLSVDTSKRSRRASLARNKKDVLSIISESFMNLFDIPTSLRHQVEFSNDEFTIPPEFDKHLLTTSLEHEYLVEGIYSEELLNRTNNFNKKLKVTPREKGFVIIDGHIRRAKIANNGSDVHYEAFVDNKDNICEVHGNITKEEINGKQAKCHTCSFSVVETKWVFDGAVEYSIVKKDKSVECKDSDEEVSSSDDDDDGDTFTCKLETQKAIDYLKQKLFEYGIKTCSVDKGSVDTGSDTNTFTLSFDYNYELQRALNTKFDPSDGMEIEKPSERPSSTPSFSKIADKIREASHIHKMEDDSIRKDMLRIGNMTTHESCILADGRLQHTALYPAKWQKLYEDYLCSGKNITKKILVYDKTHTAHAVEVQCNMSPGPKGDIYFPIKQAFDNLKLNITSYNIRAQKAAVIIGFSAPDGLYNSLKRLITRKKGHGMFSSGTQRLSELHRAMSSEINKQLELYRDDVVITTELRSYSVSDYEINIKFNEQITCQPPLKFDAPAAVETHTVGKAHVFARFPRSLIYSQFSEGVGGIYEFKDFLMKAHGACYFDPHTQKYYRYVDSTGTNTAIGKEDVADVIDHNYKEVPDVHQLQSNIMKFSIMDSTRDIVKGEIVKYQGEDHAIESINEPKKKEGKGEKTYILSGNTFAVQSSEFERTFAGNTEAQNTQLQEMINEGNLDVMLLHFSVIEGISFKEVRQIHILEPIANPSTWEQVIARAARNGSHSSLNKEDRYVQVVTWVCTIPTSYGYASTDFMNHNKAAPSANKIAMSLAATAFAGAAPIPKNAKNIAQLATLAPLIARVGMADQLVSLLKAGALAGTSFLTGMMFFLHEFLEPVGGEVVTKPVLSNLSKWTVNIYANIQQRKDYQDAIHDTAKKWQKLLSFMPYQMGNFKQNVSYDADVLQECSIQLQAIHELKEIMKELYVGSNTFSERFTNDQIHEEDKINIDEHTKKPQIRDKKDAMAVTESYQNVYKDLSKGSHIEKYTISKTIPNIKQLTIKKKV
jgi:hypothetical protein